jgi:hypothetical protein
MKLSMIAMMMFAACAASSGTSPVEPWRLDVTTSGGFAGRGTGSFGIDSTGEVRITSMGGKRCTYRATEAELARFNRLLTSSKPGTWAEHYKPENDCCDRFQYDLTLDVGGKQTKTTWIDDPAPMPQDLAALVDAITGARDSLRVVYGAQCQ